MADSDNHYGFPDEAAGDDDQSILTVSFRPAAHVKGPMSCASFFGVSDLNILSLIMILREYRVEDWKLSAEK